LLFALSLALSERTSFNSSGGSVMLDLVLDFIPTKYPEGTRDVKPVPVAGSSRAVRWPVVYILQAEFVSDPAGSA
jgi:hypothetical protein